MSTVATSGSPGSVLVAQKPGILAIVGHVLFFGAYYFLYNPFLQIDTVPRFLIYALCLVFGAALVFASSPSLDRRIMRLLVITAIIFAVAILRINFVPSVAGVTFSDQVGQSSIAAATLFLSLLISQGANIDLARRVILVAAGACSIWIFLNYADLFDWEQRGSFQLGNLSYDSYQIAAQILGAFVLCAGWYVLSGRLFSITKVILLGLIAVCIFTMLQGYARGEALAMAIGLVLMIFGRTVLIAIAILIVMFANVILATVDFPLFERIFLFLQGDRGDRDILFQQAFDIFYYEPSIMLLGGGVNYFQLFHGLELERYPHNIFLEALLVGGIPMFLVLFGIFARPIIKYFVSWESSREGRFVFAFCVYNLIIYMKSGTINSFWGLAVFGCFFMQLSGGMGNVARRVRARPLTQPRPFAGK